MKRICGLLSILLVISICLGQSVSAFAFPGNKEMKGILDVVLSDFKDRYEINGEKITVIEKEKETVEFLYEMTACLAYSEVDEMSYVKGIKRGLQECLSVAKGEMSNKEYESFEKKIVAVAEEEIKRIETYIGFDQVIPFYFEYDTKNKALYVCHGAERELCEKFEIPSDDTLFETGRNFIEREIDELICAESKENKAPSRGSFSVYNEVLYSSTYSSNPTTCNLHGNDGFKVNTAKYNSAYTNYAGTHSDCANFVSQCLVAGGLPTDGTWYNGSNAWLGTLSMKSYMDSSSKFAGRSYSSLSTGDIMFYTNSAGASHVVILSAFDGATWRETGHTNDELNAACSTPASGRYYYHVTY